MSLFGPVNDERRLLTVTVCRHIEIQTTLRQVHNTKSTKVVVPLRMDPASTTWWGAWCQEKRASGAPSGPAAPAAPSVVTPAAAAWHAGHEIKIGDAHYLLQGGAVEWTSTDGSLVWKAATAAQMGPIDPNDLAVRLRQIRMLRTVPAAEQRRAGLRAQTRLAGASFVDIVDHDATTTIVTRHPLGRPWHDVFGPADVPPDRLTAATALAAAAEVCKALDALHEAGHSHRAIGPEEIVIPLKSGGAQLRDLGFAGMPASEDDRSAGQPAPEQARPPYGAGAHTDIYQVAAVVYHTMTSHPPGRVCPPIRATMSDFPAETDDVVLQCLRPDSAQRPASILVLENALRRGHRLLSAGRSE